MVRARLHLICGNCGCPDEFTFSIVPTYTDAEETEMRDTVYLHCRNCATSHAIEDNAKPEGAKQ